MTRDKVLALLRSFNERNDGDIEEEHEQADQALLALIGDAEITEAFNAMYKWYA